MNLPLSIDVDGETGEYRLMVGPWTIASVIGAENDVTATCKLLTMAVMQAGPIIRREVQ